MEWKVDEQLKQVCRAKIRAIFRAIFRAIIHVFGPNRHKKRAHEGRFTPEDFDEEKFKEYCAEREAEFAEAERDRRAAAKKASQVLRGEEDEEDRESQEDFEEPKKSPIKVTLGRQVSSNSCQYSSHISCLVFISGMVLRKPLSWLGFRFNRKRKPPKSKPIVSDDEDEEIIKPSPQKSPPRRSNWSRRKAELADSQQSGGKPPK